MSLPEEKIVKIVDTTVHSRGASVVQSGSYGALAVQGIESVPTDSSRVNGSIVISNADTAVSTTTTITKTIGTTDYVKTLSFNANGDLISISAWVEI